MSAHAGGWVGPVGFAEGSAQQGEQVTVRLSGFKGPPDPFAEFLTDLRDRLIATEARQRAYGQHDPACPRLLDDQAQAKTDWLMGKRDCDCWLSREAT